MSPPTPKTILVLPGVILLLLAGCGGKSHAPKRTVSTAPPTTTTAPPTTTTTTTERPSSVTGVIVARLIGENHEPIVNRPWRYRVTVTDARGRKLSGTETTQYTYGGTVVGVEKPENVSFTGGVYRDTIEFPAEAVGYPLAVQTVVHTSLGSVTLDWPIKVRR